MARERKKVELKPVDEEIPADSGSEQVVRLGDSSPPSRRVSRAPAPAPAPTRLEAVRAQRHEARSHEPDIGSLIESPDPFVMDDPWAESKSAGTPMPWGWFALVGLALLAALVWSVTQIDKASEPAAKIVRAAAASREVDVQEDEKAARFIESLEKSIASYASATSIEELLPWVRHPEHVLPLMEKYYADKKVGAHGPMARVTRMQPLDLGTLTRFWACTVETTQGETFYLLIEADDDSAPKIDWETAVKYQPMDWDDYATHRPKNSVFEFRVHARPDNLYSHEFANSKQWSCFLLDTRGAQESLFGYVRRGTPTEATLLKLAQQNPHNRAAVILRLRIPAGLNSPRGVVIEEVVSERWIRLTPPDTEP